MMSAATRAALRHKFIATIVREWSDRQHTTVFTIISLLFSFD